MCASRMMTKVGDDERCFTHLLHFPCHEKSLFLLYTPGSKTTHGWRTTSNSFTLCHSLHRCRERDEQHSVSAVDPGDGQAGGAH